MAEINTRYTDEEINNVNLAIVNYLGIQPANVIRDSLVVRYNSDNTVSVNAEVRYVMSHEEFKGLLNAIR